MAGRRRRTSDVAAPSTPRPCCAASACLPRSGASPVPAPAPAQRSRRASRCNLYDPLAPAPTDDSVQKKPRPYQALRSQPAAADGGPAQAIRADRRRRPAPAIGVSIPATRESACAPSRSDARATARDASSDRDIAPGDPGRRRYRLIKRAAADRAKSAYASAASRASRRSSSARIPPTRKKKKKRDEADPYDPLGMRSGGLLYLSRGRTDRRLRLQSVATSNGKGAAVCHGRAGIAGALRLAGARVQGRLCAAAITGTSRTACRRSTGPISTAPPKAAST